MEILKNPNYDFLGKTRYFVALSAIFIASGVAIMTTRGVKYGVEFSGGTQVIASFQSTPQVDRVVNPEAEAAKEKVMLALHITSTALGDAQRAIRDDDEKPQR